MGFLCPQEALNTWSLDHSCTQPLFFWLQIFTSRAGTLASHSPGKLLPIFLPFPIEVWASFLPAPTQRQGVLLFLVPFPVLRIQHLNFTERFCITYIDISKPWLFPRLGVVQVANVQWEAKVLQQQSLFKQGQDPWVVHIQRLKQS